MSTNPPPITRRSALLSGGALLAGSAFPSLLFADEAKRGGVLTVHMNGEQRILNPSLRASTGVYVVTSKIIEPLVDLGPDGKPKPVLATAWESSPDGKTITFRLRESVSWHDGKPFTSADVQYTAMEMWKKHLEAGTTLQPSLERRLLTATHQAGVAAPGPQPLARGRWSRRAGEGTVRLCAQSAARTGAARSQQAAA